MPRCPWCPPVQAARRQSSALFNPDGRAGYIRPLRVPPPHPQQSKPIRRGGTCAARRPGREPRPPPSQSLGTPVPHGSCSGVHGVPAFKRRAASRRRRSILMGGPDVSGPYEYHHPTTNNPGLCAGATRVPNKQKRGTVACAPWDCEFGSGGWIRTNGLRVMSPTSFHCSTPRCASPHYHCLYVLCPT